MLKLIKIQLKSEMLESPLRKSENPEKNLTPRQLKFCHEYIIDENPVYAYIRAGYHKRLQAAQEESLKLLNLTKIQAKIKQLKTEKLEKALNRQLRIAAELAKIASPGRKLL